MAPTCVEEPAPEEIPAVFRGGTYRGQIERFLELVRGLE
jgi:hypothetical protein